METHVSQWEDSYFRNENFIFYPKDEVIKFINRFVRKRIGFSNYINIIDFSENKIKGLDYGCGIGASARLMAEFDIDAFGIDISSLAINQAINISKSHGISKECPKFMLFDGEKIPFKDNEFDISIAESVLDSMEFELAKIVIKELSRVTSKFIFISLISGDDDCHHREYSGEEVVMGQHENGTIQSYFNMTKINELISETGLLIKWCRLVTEESVIDKYKYSRYYIVLEHNA